MALSVFKRDQRIHAIACAEIEPNEVLFVDWDALIFTDEKFVDNLRVSEIINTKASTPEIPQKKVRPNSPETTPKSKISQEKTQRPRTPEVPPKSSKPIKEKSSKTEISPEVSKKNSKKSSKSPTTEDASTRKTRSRKNYIPILSDLKPGSQLSYREEVIQLMPSGIY